MSCCFLLILYIPFFYYYYMLQVVVMDELLFFTLFILLQYTFTTTPLPKAAGGCQGQPALCSGAEGRGQAEEELQFFTLPLYLLCLYNVYSTIIHTTPICILPPYFTIPLPQAAASCWGRCARPVCVQLQLSTPPLRRQHTSAYVRLS